MIRASLPIQKKNPNFIGSYKIKPLSLCDDIISYFENNHIRHKQGTSGSGINLDAKNSTDIKVRPKEINQSKNKALHEYMENLASCFQSYADDSSFLSIFKDPLQIGSFNIQRYNEGQHFKKIHSERASMSTLHRVFAWMTYLNDIDMDCGGSTYFSHYDLEIFAEKGLTMIWPAEWTHAHRGNELKIGRKYIITGWAHFAPNTNES
mgnify:CR=1 FL=1